ncbi:MAG: TrpB-like pyridoxal phosphate-dependent enzyme [Candidatus Lokiarchaeota archaeon]|nr:TrpB-like pyridoxal phosphate-dependent enzyme [Candidatus Lokiarchaeota archaeon]
MDAINPIIRLPPEKMPKNYLNMAAVLGYQLPLISPVTLKPATPEEALMMFPQGIVAQEMNFTDREIPIDDELRAAYYYAQRPTPLHRAFRLEKALGLKDHVHIYYKNESVSPAGSHKTNTAIAQAYYAKKQGIKAFATETGAGQWGSALAYATSLFGLQCRVYMVRASYRQKPYRGILMRTYGASVVESPSNITEVGKRFYDKDNNHPGSLGLAISEAIEDVIKNNDTTRYSLGSVINSVLLHQTIIGQEAKMQMEMAKEYPDIVIGCHGGGSNFFGAASAFLADKIEGKANPTIIAAEAAAAPKLTKGIYAFDYGDTGHVAPIAKMYTVGSDFIPAPVHAGGLRYHGAAMLVSLALSKQLISAVALKQTDIIKAGVLFAKSEGFVPAPESCHAICEAIRQAKAANEKNEKKVIFFNCSGHGFFDMAAYQDFMDGKLVDYELPDKSIKDSIALLPKIPGFQ